MCTSMNSSFTAAKRFQCANTVVRSSAGISSPARIESMLGVINVPPWPNPPTSLEEVRLQGFDLVPERLEAAPAVQRLADLFVRMRRHFVRERSVGGPSTRRCERADEQHRLRAALEQVEPERSLVDGLADREQAVVLEDQRFARADRRGEAARLGRVVDRAGEIAEYRVVLVERAVVLADRLPRATRARPHA